VSALDIRLEVTETSSRRKCGNVGKGWHSSYSSSPRASSTERRAAGADTSLLRVGDSVGHGRKRLSEGRLKRARLIGRNEVGNSVVLETAEAMTLPVLPMLKSTAGFAVSRSGRDRAGGTDHIATTTRCPVTVKRETVGGFDDARRTALISRQHQDELRLHF
jgi:hypothetical protein